MKKKYDFNKKYLKKMLPGFWLRFSILDPIGDHDKPVNVEVGHSNSIINYRLDDDFFWHDFRCCLDKNRIKWKIDIAMEFKKHGKTEVKSTELIAVGRMSEIDQVYQEVLEQMFDDAVKKNYIKNYVRTRVAQSVLSGYSINDDDFSE